MGIHRRRRVSAVARVHALAILGLLLPSSFASAQSLDGTGAVSVGLLLRQMDGVKRVLMIGAHPDDEDTSLLTTLDRGWGAETAYLSLTRGDGGQNVIGPELWEGLGVIRTGELDAARALDGGAQFFTRAFDYGFSKSAEEALTFWPHEELLADVVWVIRRFRPHVVVSVWSGTARDGHGQHQASGIIAREAFEAAGDPLRFTEQLALGVEAWAPDKYYVSNRFGGRGGGPEGEPLRIETGRLDPLLGRSLFQLSMESRSQHRSQDMGSPEPLGPAATGVALVESRVPGGEEGFFAGIDTTLYGLTVGLGDPDPTRARGELGLIRGRNQIRDYQAAVQRAQEEFGLDPSAIVDDLADALGSLRGAREDLAPIQDRELHQVLERREELTMRAFAAAAGLTLDVWAEDDLIVAGQTVRVAVQLWNGGPLMLDAPTVDLGVPPGAEVTPVSVEGLSAPGRIAPGSLVTWAFDVRVPEDAEPSRLYYLREAREGAWYSWPDVPAVWGLSRDPVPVTATVAFRAGAPDPPTELDGARIDSEETPIEMERGWRYVDVDPTKGEYAKRVLVVPAVSVQIAPPGLVWPSSSADARSLSVVVRNEAEGGSRGDVAIEPPSGWSVDPAAQPFSLEEAGAERTLTFTIRPSGSPTPGQHVFDATARTEDGRAYREGYTLVDYEHIERAAIYSAAEARVTVIPMAVAENLRVGYIMGSGDDAPEAIRQLGVDVVLLDESRVRAGDFDGFDVVVLGVRAEETRPDLRAASGQLGDFVRDGGVVVAQYNRGPLGSIAPLPLDVGRGAPRVADETAPVRILDPSAPVFTTPNRIEPADFEGWVQERGLYFASEWDEAYVPLLELNDPGEPPARGSLLVVSEGEGVFVYAALSFFRQWTEGVPGAYRLFANLLSLDPESWRAWAARAIAGRRSRPRGGDLRPATSFRPRGSAASPRRARPPRR